MSESSARLGMPWLQAGQAQKEVTHNEALALVDLALAAAVEAVGAETPPFEPEEGQAWILGTNPSGAWAGRGEALAGWTGGGWRFVTPFEGLSAWIVAEKLPARFTGGAWVVGEARASRLLVDGLQVVGPRRPAITAPSGGATVDGEARAALSAMLEALRAHGLIAS